MVHLLVGATALARTAAVSQGIEAMGSLVVIVQRYLLALVTSPSASRLLLSCDAS